MQSLLSAAGLPEQFGTVLLLLALILLLAPYLAGTDLGVIKIPSFSSGARHNLRIAGPIAMLAALLLHVPFLHKKETKTIATAPCSISGLVFDNDSNKPLSGVWVDLYRDLKSIQQRPAQLKAGVATTGPDGRFSFNCDEISEAEYPLLLAVRHQDWIATHITGPKIERRGEWNGINIPIAMSDIKMKSLRELQVSFTSDKKGSDWFVKGDIENKSERLFPCIELKFQMSTSYQDKIQGELDRDLGLISVEVRNVKPHEKQPYEIQLPKRVGISFASKQECR